MGAPLRVQNMEASIIQGILLVGMAMHIWAVEHNVVVFWDVISIAVQWQERLTQQSIVLI